MGNKLSTSAISRGKKKGPLKGNAGGCAAECRDQKTQADETNRYSREPSLKGRPARPNEGSASSAPDTVEKEFVVAIYDFNGRVPEELSFVVGTRFEIINKMDSDWWRVCNVKTLQEGYVAAGYVVTDTSLRAAEWYFGAMSRGEAERLLMDPGLPEGTFLVRDSTSQGQHSLTISVKAKITGRIKHHPVFKSDGLFFCVPQNQFRSMQDLIYFYRNPDSRTESVLGMPCPKIAPQPLPPPGQSWEIDRKTIQFGDLLGKGNFGEVKYGKWLGVQEVAIKTLKQVDKKSIENFLLEANIMKKIRHENVCLLYGVCTTEVPIIMVMEYMNRGSLLSILQEEGEHMETFQLIEILAQVASGMAYLESIELIHRDLAARNVLMDSKKPCKIADFGLARILDYGIYCQSNDTMLPVKWMAPEVIHKQQYSTRSDVWSFGILMYEVITNGGSPYPAMNTSRVAEIILTDYRMKLPTHPRLCPEPLYDLMLDCWHRDPIRRVTFDFIHKYLNDYRTSSEMSYEDMP